MIHNRMKRRAGQGMTEYIILVALVAIASISVVTIFGDQVRELFSACTQNLQGNAVDPKAVADPTVEVNHKINDL